MQAAIWMRCLTAEESKKIMPDTKNGSIEKTFRTPEFKKIFYIFSEVP